MFPLFVLKFVVCMPTKTLESKSYQRKFGTLYEEIKTDSKGSLLFYFYFMMRRCTFSLMAVFSSEYPCLQVMSLMMTQVMLCLYFGYFWPF